MENEPTMFVFIVTLEKEYCFAVAVTVLKAISVERHNKQRRNLRRTTNIEPSGGWPSGFPTDPSNGKPPESF